MPEPVNLNTFEPETDYSGQSKNNQDNSASSENIAVYFRNLVGHLKRHIGEADVVVGCVAWLTHPEILDALRSKSVAIVVQKEDFLRPDLGASSNWKRELRRRYTALRSNLNRFEFDNMMSSLSVGSDTSVDAIRCVGNFNREKSPAFPRMHNKFLIFGNMIDEESRSVVRPYAVWTGSFNLTFNAANSLENALVIQDQTVVNAYFHEFGQIMALSEPLDWESEWSAPEWRIGS